ncbi:MAG: AAA family ATPase [Deltaproteobacteria bacterium]|nr:AAA family ATPase [Deltaproteobacteria bacterium]
MYLHYFNLKEEPFSMTPDPRFFYLSRQHEGAIEAFLYGIEQRKGFLLLTGEIGTGKTTLCRELINRLDDKTEISVIFNPLLSVAGLLQAINRDFGNPVQGETEEVQLDGLNRFLLEGLKKGRNAIVLIDEAQNLSVEALEMTRLLSNLETDKQKLLQIILVGQPELEMTLRKDSLRQLNQRIHIREHLRPLHFNEMQEYIFHRLLLAGGEGRVHFLPNALRKVFRWTKGTPRLINIVCDRALLAAYASRKTVIDKQLATVAIRDVSGKAGQPWWQFWRRIPVSL